MDCELTVSPCVVSLISQEGVIFEVERELLKYSKTLSMFMDESLSFNEYQTSTITLPGISTNLLKRLCEFLKFKREWDGKNYFPEWQITAEESVDMLLAADYLEM